MSMESSLWDELRALRRGERMGLTLLPGQADEILRTNDLLQRLTCDASNSLSQFRAVLEQMVDALLLPTCGPRKRTRWRSSDSFKSSIPIAITG